MDFSLHSNIIFSSLNANMCRYYEGWDLSVVGMLLVIMSDYCLAKPKLRTFA